MNAHSTARRANLPDFLCIGAQRSGTTWLDRQLRLHRDIVMPADRKEVHFFDDNHDRGSDWYAALFETPLHDHSEVPPVRGEITPKYLFHPEVPARIHTLLPDVKLVAMLRNPAERAWSHFGHSRRNSNYTGSFDQFLQVNEQAFTRGLYAEQLDRYLALFDRAQIRLFVFEEVIAAPAQAVAELCDFLGVDPLRMREDVEHGKSNESYLPKHAGAYRRAIRTVQWLRRNDLHWVFNLAKRLGLSGRLFGTRGEHESMSSEARTTLMARYSDDMQRLESMFDLDLDIWRRDTRKTIR